MLGAPGTAQLDAASRPTPSLNQLEKTVNAPVQPFNPAEVPINYTLNFHQVNLILEGLDELKRKQSNGFYDQFRNVALQTLQVAEQAHKEAVEKAAAEAADQARADQLKAAAEQGNPVAQAVLAKEGTD